MTSTTTRAKNPATEHGKRLLTVLRWLGPWADQSRMPHARAEVVEAPAKLLRVSAGRDRSTILLLPGLHFLGPDDRRFRRLAAVLAATGAEVVAPYLSDFLGLRLTPRLIAEAEAALLVASERGPVSVMSISFGSIAAFHLAAKYPERIKRMVVFGGYRNLELSFRFALGGAIAGVPAQVRDPLNGPAVVANLVEDMLPEAQADAFRAAALAFSRRTWSRDGAIQDKHDGRHLKVGAEIAASLEGDAAHLFRVAARLEGNPLDVVDAVFERARERFAFLDPTPLMGRIEAPVACVHGRDDDVIPWSESVAMARDLRNGSAYITGLYGHTGRANGAAAGALVRELRAMAGVIDAMASLAR